MEHFFEKKCLKNQKVEKSLSQMLMMDFVYGAIGAVLMWVVVCLAFFI